MSDFKEVRGFEGLYKVYKDGSVWSVRGNKFLSTGDNGRGYKFLFLYNNGHKKRFYLHRLVATLFLSNEQQLPQVNHINGNKSDNRVENLEWCSLEHNMQHAWKKGLCKPHENQKQAARNNAKLRRLFSDDDVFEMRYLYAMGARMYQIAKEFGVTGGAVRNIIDYKVYKEVV